MYRRNHLTVNQSDLETSHDRHKANCRLPVGKPIAGTLAFSGKSEWHEGQVVKVGFVWGKTLRVKPVTGNKVSRWLCLGQNVQGQTCNRQ